MRLVTSGLVLSALHLALVVATFLAFGLGLEGERNLGHDLLWLLLEPASSLPDAPLALLPFHSALWGFSCALAFEVFRRLG